MEKLTVLNTFQKSIDALKSVDCTQKEKLNYFGQISDCIQSSSFRSNLNHYQNHLSTAISVLLLFCEEIDSVIRMNAEENLYKVIRFCENNNNIIRVQIDLYHEIKKNGNEKSLRICLNLFGYYSNTVKQRKAKSYAQNLLPCIYAISKRKETLVIESLCEFMKIFCSNLQICMTDNEVLKLIEIFVLDTTSDCAVKRRCSTQNVISLIENSRNREYFGKCALNKCLEMATKDQNPNSVIGALGLLRVLLSIILEFVKFDVQQTLEIYDLCLHYLNESNHTIINAALEVINTILTADNDSLNNMLKNDNLEHRDLLFRKKTLKNMIFRITFNESRRSSRKSSSDTIKNESKTVMSVNVGDELVTPSNESKLKMNLQLLLPVEDKSLTSSDAEMDSFKSIDFDTDIALSQSVLKIMSNNDEEKKDETASLKSQKSTDSIGSFFNTLLSHSNTAETVSKFFRTKSTESPLVTPKSLDKAFFKYSDDDNLSIESLGSHISGQGSGNDLLISKETTILEDEQSFTEIVKIENNTLPVVEKSVSETTEVEIVPEDANNRELIIGTIYDQNILEYTIRLICSKFLLTGAKHNLISDQQIRISIKSLSLLVISNCVLLKPQYLLSTLEKVNLNNSDEVLDQNELFELLDDLSDESEEKENATETLEKKENFLEIKDDHFGECTTAYFDYFSAMSLSLDQGLISLKSKMKVSQDKWNENNNAKLSRDLDKVLSKSDYVERKSQRLRTIPQITRNAPQSQSKSEQIVCDILLFYNHSDPILRGNVQTLIGNFLKSILADNKNYHKFIEIYSHNNDVLCFMKYDKLMKIMMIGLQDEIHTVIKLTLGALDGLLPFILRKLPLNQQQVESNDFHDILQNNEANNILLSKNYCETITTKMILENLNIVFNNKYWLVQCKYSEIIAAINFRDIESVLGEEFREMFEDMCLRNLLLLLHDSDFRVRNQASKSICNLLNNISSSGESYNLRPSNPICGFIDAKIFSHLAEPLNLMNKTFTSNEKLAKNLSKILYYISNKLFDIQHKNDLFGAINTIKELLQHFNPIEYSRIWKESNLLNVIVGLLNENVSIGLDLTCQSDLLNITSILFAASAATSPDITHVKEHPKIDCFIIHSLKILNIYHHLFSNVKPILIPKTQKADLFITPKELLLIQSVGYFGNEYFYLKLFNILKNSYESYKITINKESGEKMIILLESLLISLNRILSIKSIFNMTNGTKFVQEILNYLQTLFNFSPKLCIKTTKCLLVFNFGQNFINRRADYQNLIEKNSSRETLDLIGEFEVFKSELIMVMVDGTRLDYSSYIKMFEPVVIQCLKLFTKSNSDVQTSILEIICKLLEFKVNYYLLDSNNVFIDFVLSYLDLIIEKGSIRNSHVLVPKILEFLFHLTKSSDKKLITIPKIINITDQLLANNMINGTGITALLTLCYEIYFKQPRNSSNSELMIKEMDTQKEVLLSMMMKCLEHVEVQQLLTILIVLEKDSESSTVQEDVLSTTLQLLYEDKLMITNVEEYKSIITLFNTFSKNNLLQSKNIEIIIQIFTKFTETNINNLNQIAIYCIILEKVLIYAEEIYFMNILKLFITKQQSSSMLNEHQYFVNLIIRSLEQMFDYPNRHQHNILFDGLCQKYLQCLTSILLKFSTITNVFKIELNNNSTLLFTTINNYVTKLIWLELLIDIGFDLNYILTQFVQFGNDNLDEKDLKIRLYSKILNDEKTIALNEDIFNTVLEQSFELFLYVFNEILCRYVAQDTYSCLIIFKLKEFLDYHSNDVDELVIMKYVLRILKKANLNTFSGTLDLLLKQEPHIYCNDIILKNVGAIMKKKLDFIKSLPSNEIEAIVSENDFKLIETFCDQNQNYKIYIEVNDTLRAIGKIMNRKMMKLQPLEKTYDNIRNKVMDEAWFLEQISLFTTSAKDNDIDNLNATNFLLEVKSESKLINILSSKALNNKLLKTAIELSFKTMIELFQIDCVTFNSHINYLKIPPLLKVSIIILIKKIDAVIASGHEALDAVEFNSYVEALIVLIKNLMNLGELCLIYIDAKHIEKFINDNLLKQSYVQSFIKISGMCLKRIENSFNAKNIDLTQIQLYLNYCKYMLSYKCVWNELNNENEEYYETKKLYIKIIFNYFNVLLKNSKMIREYVNPTLFDDLGLKPATVDLYLSVIFLGKYFDNPENKYLANKEYCHLLELLDDMEEIAVLIMKMNEFYIFSITPYDVVLNYDKTLLTANNKLPSIPIDYLTDVEILQKFVRRINVFGFSSRQQFEELIMTLLLLINTKNDPDIIDIQEQYEIKNMCLYAITELLLECHKYPNIGFNNQKFHHFPRLPKIKPTNICLKKLHNIQLILAPVSNIFYQGNLDRNLTQHDNIIGTKKFQLNQFCVDFTWQTIDDSNFTSSKDICMNKNSKYFIEKSGIDLKSSMQLIFDVFSQLIEENHVLVLTHLVKLSDICCSRDQFKWINTAMLELQERIPREDTLSHQNIIYLLCKSYAVIIPSLSELTHLCAIIPQYLKSTQLFIRTATLNGLLCLLECFVKTNTAIGSLNEELQMLRNIIINYIVKHGIIEESPSQLSDYHTKLVWSLNFYLIETTTKFVPECNLLSNTIISANNILKRTTNLEIYLCILHGLERLVVTNTTNKLYREKIENLSLELVKLDNELFSIPALKLLISCMYMGSAEQLENTEQSNGIVQDEPEIIMASTEKVEALFARIRSSTPYGATIIGNTLCQIIKDLLPPNEILTRCIKEFLILTQPHPNIIAKITYQLFRSAIDASYLSMLQDWLIFSLPNFLQFNQLNKIIWSLTIIFISSSLNQYLLKMFPKILNVTSNSFSQTLCDNDIQLFMLSSKDFYDKLSSQQKDRFRIVFQNKTDNLIFLNMLQSL